MSSFSFSNIENQIYSYDLFLQFTFTLFSSRLYVFLYDKESLDLNTNFKNIIWLRSFERRFIFININIYERYLFKRRRLICIIILFQLIKKNKNIFFLFEYVYLKKKNDFFFIYSLLQSNQIFFFFILIEKLKKDFNQSTLLELFYWLFHISMFIDTYLDTLFVFLFIH